MAGSVIHKTPEGSMPALWTTADAIAGHRVDRRRCYVLIDGELTMAVGWVDDCTGCTEYLDYGVKVGGGGCSECGYTGKRRRAHWVPYSRDDDA